MKRLSMSIECLNFSLLTIFKMNRICKYAHFKATQVAKQCDNYFYQYNLSIDIYDFMEKKFMLNTENKKVEQTINDTHSSIRASKNVLL